MFFVRWVFSYSFGTKMFDTSLNHVLLGCFQPQDNKKMKRSLEEEQRARKDLEKVVRRVLKSMNDQTWDETNL